jgi:hypothetical protein
MLGFAGVTAIETSVAGVTAKVTAAEVTPFNVAVTEVLPGDRLVASPSVPVLLLTVATEVFDEAQVTADVRF